MPSTSNDLHLQLCVNDLLHPTEKSESLLEALTANQLDEIEKTLSKIKMKKKSLPKPTGSEKQMTVSDTPRSMQRDWTLVAAQIAKALANTMSSSLTATPSKTKPPLPTAEPDSDKSPLCSPSVSDNTSTETTGSVTSHEPYTEMRDGIEWVSFVYSHHRILRRYSIRTDIDQVDLEGLEESFKNENCVYPRANLPRDDYKGNRWAYETECNTLGWKLAYLNASEISGKRGLIQRAVDSYRNRYPSMRSRRVARQEKLLKGTLRKRKQRESEEPEEPQGKRSETDTPKTVSIHDGHGQHKCKIRMNVDSVCLDVIDVDFRKSNCVYPRAMEINTKSPFASQKQLEEVRCNELAWKLAWLNPKQLANRKNLLQRALDVYRSKYMPGLNPRRKNSVCTASDSGKSKPKTVRRKSQDDSESLYSAADSMDDCLSPSTEFPTDTARTVSLNDLMLPGPTTATCNNTFLFEPTVFETVADHRQRNSRGFSVLGAAGSHGVSNFLVPKKEPLDSNDALSRDSSNIFDLYTNGFEQNEYIKTEEDA
ncbi:hypothetical protein BY458DRAFT_545502 [Sporodiniella umbellata]|nr:hypothetical protein BY458DRAFT_545502 [Sporodiniella umbellata]